MKQESDNVPNTNSRMILDLLEMSSNKGSVVIPLHVFSDGRLLGKILFYEDRVLLSGDVTPQLCNKVRNYLGDKEEELYSKRTIEFSLDLGGHQFRIAAELLGKPPHIYVFGAGHVGQAVAGIGALIGYNITVVDDRREFLTRDRFPNVDICLMEQNYDTVESIIEVPTNSAIVIVTRGHQFDEICLHQVVKLNPRYIGMIGSRRRVLSIFTKLVAAGVDKELLDRVHAPIGLKIDAVSPQEIGVSIMAEIISVMNGKVDLRGEIL